MAIMMVRIHVLPEQSHLRHSFGCKTADFFDHTGHGTAALPTPGERDDTKRAKIITATHYRDPGIDTADPRGIHVRVCFEF